MRALLLSFGRAGVTALHGVLAALEVYAAALDLFLSLGQTLLAGAPLGLGRLHQAGVPHLHLGFGHPQTGFSFGDALPQPITRCRMRWSFPNMVSLRSASDARSVAYCPSG